MVKQQTTQFVSFGL